jgi:hypothetical protein
MECLVCEEPSEVGSLCRACAHKVAPPDWLIPEYIIDQVESVDADAWLVDGFGQTHPVTAGTAIGRHEESQLRVLAKSVSREHAELSRKDNQWLIKDVSSNGTFVGGTRIQGRANLADKSIVRLGDVPMWFLSAVITKPRTVSPETVPVTDVCVYEVVPKTGAALQLVGDRAGGTIRSRQDSGWGPERPLSSLQYQMFRMLCAAAVADTAPTEIRGCVPTARFIAELPWSSTIYPDESNVRQHVKGLRTTLAEVGIQKLVENQPVRGYYLVGTVTPRLGST